MNISVRKILESLGIAIGIIIVSSLLISTLHILNILSKNVVTFLKIVIPIIALFTGSYLISKEEKTNGWKNGLLFGTIYFIIMFFLNLFIKGEVILLKQFLFFLILLVSSVLGGMMGVYFNQEEEK